MMQINIPIFFRIPLLPLVELNVPVLYPATTPVIKSMIIRIAKAFIGVSMPPIARSKSAQRNPKAIPILSSAVVHKF